jgi:DNA replication protein DnaC
MRTELLDYLKKLGYDGEPPEFSERDTEQFMRHRALCSECPGLDHCKEYGHVLQIYLGPDKKNVRIAMGPCKKRLVRDGLRRSEKLFSEAAIPPIFRECDFENYAAEGRSEGVQYAKVAAKRAVVTGSSLVLAGAVGAGKSHLAAAIARAALTQGRTAFFISAIDYLERLKSTFEGNQSGLYMQMVDHVKSVSCLVIDDMGAEKPSAWTIARLYDVINVRMERGRQTIVTTNYPNAAALIRRLESDPFGARRIVSRLLHFGWVTIRGDDYRIHMRKNNRNYHAHTLS